MVVYGALLLLIDRVAPQYLVAGNLLVLAAGLAFLIVWMLRRGTFAAVRGRVPDRIGRPGRDAEGNRHRPAPGFGTLCYGVALLFIGAVRMTRGGGIGWQALIGVLLVALGGSEMVLPDAAALVLPILLVVFGRCS